MVLQNPHLLTVREVADRLRQDETTIRRKIREGQLPGVKIGLGPRAPLRVDSGELDRWLFEEGA
jgi:excisionase family DNA binding protein